MPRPNLQGMGHVELLAYLGKHILSVRREAAAAWLGDLAGDDPICSEEDPPFELEGKSKSSE